MSATLPDQTQVVVVGAGPTGLAAACALATRGVEVVVLDRLAEGGNTSRAAVVHARTLEVLDEVDVSRELVRRGVVVPHFVIRDRDSALFTVPFEQLPTRYPYTLMVPQDVTERVLADRLRALGGVVHRGHEVTGVAADDDGVTVAVRLPDGSPGRVRGGFVVGCDGMHSTVREQAGIGFTGSPYAESFVLADVHMYWPLSRREVHLFFSPAGLVVVAPLPEDRFRIVATMDEAPEHPAPTELQALLDARGPVRERAVVRDVVWGSRFRVHHRLADAYRRGRVLLAGDAAHVHSPAGGQGMNTGIQDAMALAPMLADVLDGAAGPARLDAYEAARRPVAQGVIRTTHRLTRAATVRGPIGRALRNLGFRAAGHLPPVRRRFAMNLSELATAPRDPSEVTRGPVADAPPPAEEHPSDQRPRPADASR
jgi:2-polyprenyl-6-methoxyphenol hydroxylase-like FAD-dependent oxidoreductase